MLAGVAQEVSWNGTVITKGAGQAITTAFLLSRGTYQLFLSSIMYRQYKSLLNVKSQYSEVRRGSGAHIMQHCCDFCGSSEHDSVTQ